MVAGVGRGYLYLRRGVVRNSECNRRREGRWPDRGAHGGLPAAERNRIRGLVPKSPEWAASFDRWKAKFTIKKADAAKTPGN